MRCVNILVKEVISVLFLTVLQLSKNLDIKISGVSHGFTLTVADFGVSVWFDENGSMRKKAFYIGGKDMYSFLSNVEEDQQFTYTVQFDLRYNWFRHSIPPDYLGLC